MHTSFFTTKLWEYSMKKYQQEKTSFGTTPTRGVCGGLSGKNYYKCFKCGATSFEEEIQIHKEGCKGTFNKEY